MMTAHEDAIMSSEEFRKIKNILGWSAVMIGHRLGADARTVRRWANSDGNVPGPVAVAMRGLGGLK